MLQHSMVNKEFYFYLFYF